MTVPTLRGGRKLGLRLERPVTFLMTDYLDVNALKKSMPPLPKNFGHSRVLGAEWGMLGNDVAGDCFFAGACHQTMLWTAESRDQAKFTDAEALRAYSEATGYDESKPDSDQGTDLSEGCEYWRTTGLPDVTGKRHKIVAYLALDPTVPEIRWYADFLFSGSGLGVDLPSNAEDQFDAGDPWTYLRGSSSLGGHFVNSLGRQDGVAVLGTWGKAQRASEYWISKYAVQGVAFVTTENLVNNKSPEGFDSQSLLADLARLKS